MAKASSFWTEVKLVAKDKKGVAHSIPLVEQKGSLNMQIFSIPEKSSVECLTSRKGIYLPKTGAKRKANSKSDSDS